MTAEPREAAGPAGRPAPDGPAAAEAAVVPRRFLVERLPELMWLLERRMTVSWWSLGAGWDLRVQRHHSGPGPVSIASVQRADDQRGGTYHWFRPEDKDRATRAEAALDDLLLSNGGHSLEKTTRGCMLAGVWWEFDEFHGRLEGLVIAESEHASALDPWITSPWIGREVTGEPGYDERLLAGGSSGA